MSAAEVFAEKRRGEVIRSCTYAQVTHFTSGDKYVTVHYDNGREMLTVEPLKSLLARFPDLVQIHRRTLVKVEAVDFTVWCKRAREFMVVMKNGTRLRTSRDGGERIRALLRCTKEVKV